MGHINPTPLPSKMLPPWDQSGACLPRASTAQILTPLTSSRMGSFPHSFFLFVSAGQVRRELRGLLSFSGTWLPSFPRCAPHANEDGRVIVRWGGGTRRAFCLMQCTASPVRASVGEEARHRGHVDGLALGSWTPDTASAPITVRSLGVNRLTLQQLSRNTLGLLPERDFWDDMRHSQVTSNCQLTTPGPVAHSSIKLHKHKNPDTGELAPRAQYRHSSHSPTAQSLSPQSGCSEVEELPARPLPIELELELIQSHMAQKPVLVLRGEVGCACVAREVGVERGGMGERGCARRPLTHPLSQATSCVFRITPHYTKRQNSLRYLCGSRPLKGTALRAGPRWLHPS